MLKKIIEIETSEGLLEITAQDHNGYWDVEEVKFPETKVIDCNGIWPDEVIFRVEGDYQIRMTTELLLGIIRATRALAEEDDGWFSRQPELKQKLEMALGIWKEKKNK